jgi:hypothetical protein
VTRVLRGAEVVFAAAAVAATVWAYQGFFAGHGYLLPLLAATVAGVLCAVPAATLRWGVSATMATAIAGFLVAAGAELLEHGTDAGHLPKALGAGIAAGWMRMLTVGRPADPTPELLLLPALAVYAAGFAMTTVAVRTRAALAPLPFPLLPLLTALLVTVGHHRGTLRVAGVTLAALMALLLIRVARLDGATGAARFADRARFGLPTVASVAVAAVAVAHLTPIDERRQFDPRTLIRPEMTIENTVNPLARVRSQLEESPARKLFTVRVSGARITRVRTAALDEYDGTSWTSQDCFAAHRRLPAYHDMARSGTVGLQVHVLALDRPYLPAAGWPRRVDGDGILVNDASGVLVADKTARPVTYRVAADLYSPKGASPDPGPDTQHYLKLPAHLPSALTTAVDQLTGRATTPSAKLAALQAGLRGLPYGLTSPPGHSLGRLAGLFTSGPGRTMGYAEQHAAAFAVMARSLNFPTRVVTGYLLRRKSSSGLYTVWTSDAWAWDEVDLAGAGWTMFDPTDADNHRLLTPPPPERVPPRDSRSAPPAPPSTLALTARRPAVHFWLRGVAGPADANRLLLVLAGVLVLMIVLPAAVGAEKWRRRRARRRGSPVDRVAGAWTQSTDRLREAGLPIQRSWTALETAEAARLRFGETAAPIAVLAPLFSEACYGNRQPDRESADEAWQAELALGVALRRDRGLVRTIGAWLNPAPLARRRA